MKKLILIALTMVFACSNTHAQLKVLTNGNVGIGTTSPNNLLQVANLINFDNSKYNSAYGYNSLHSNSSGTRNVAVGYQALYSATSGSYCSAVGLNALYGNTTGYKNTANGCYTMQSNTTGHCNTAIGYYALQANTTGHYNTAVGYEAGDSYANDTNSTFLGYGADANSNYSNASAIGCGAIVTARNKMFFGNVDVIGCYNYTGVWGSYSDGRFKINVKENVQGLDFIMKLRPVTYQMDTKQLDDFIIQNMPDSFKLEHQAAMDFTASTEKVHSGFIAQEVAQAETETGFTSSIVSAPLNATDPYALNYSEIVVPLVKAVQELNSKNEKQQTVIDSLLTEIIPALTEAVNEQENKNIQLQSDLNECCKKSGESSMRSTNQNSDDNDVAALYQNTPNPFSNETQIKYFVPSSAGSASVYIYNMEGTQLKKIDITSKGNAFISVHASELKAGMYMYTLIVDGKEIDTKKMILTD